MLERLHFVLGGCIIISTVTIDRAGVHHRPQPKPAVTV